MVVSAERKLLDENGEIVGHVIDGERCSTLLYVSPAHANMIVAGTYECSMPVGHADRKAGHADRKAGHTPTPHVATVQWVEKPVGPFD